VSPDVTGIDGLTGLHQVVYFCEMNQIIVAS